MGFTCDVGGRKRVMCCGGKLMSTDTKTSTYCKVVLVVCLPAKHQAVRSRQRPENGAFEKSPHKNEPYK